MAGPLCITRFFWFFLICDCCGACWRQYGRLHRRNTVSLPILVRKCDQRARRSNNDCSTTRRGVALAVSGRGMGCASGPGSRGQHGSPAGTGRGTDDTPTGRAPRTQPRRARPWAVGAEGGRRPRVAAPRAATSGRGAWPRFPLVSTYRLGGLVLHCTL